ncbi:GntR family transcriptional regulator [Microbacterium sp.]|uniref:GntR family transcriptional regulator n=1 Tax=Microbacterium sp. TaxID=51671 RepID=UPI0037C95CB1
MIDISRGMTREDVRAHIRALVSQLSVGERLPGERDLAASLGVARMTVRHAEDALVREGLLERRQGSGTYVTPRPLVRALGLTSFSQDMRSRGLVPGSRLVSFRSITADPTLAGQLDIPVGDEVLSFTRLRLGSGIAMAVETTWLAARYAPGLCDADLEGSLYDVLATRYGITTGNARVAIEPVLPDPSVRELLDIPADQACLRLRMIDSDRRGRVIMVANCVYRGDKYHLVADVTAGAFTRAPGADS